MLADDSMRMPAIAIIPARGGSKGLPRKNTLPVGGVPLIARAVNAAHKARFVERVIVSTDDEEIARIARDAHAEVVWRPTEISGDTASSESAIFHVLDHLDREEGDTPDVIAFIQCTAPFVSPLDIDGTLEPVMLGAADSAFAAIPSHGFLWKYDDLGKLEGVNHDGGKRQRRQDLDLEYLESGSVYAMNVASFRTAGDRFCGRQAIHVTEAARSVEIDDAHELQQAQILAPLLDASGHLNGLPGEISCVVFDFDGVLTDNKVYVGQDGEETVRCDRGDGMGLATLKARGIPLLVLSKERNPVVSARCKKLGIECLQGEDQKRPALERWLADRGLNPHGLIYVGNDVNDTECLDLAASAVGPRDAHPAIQPLLGLTLSALGGSGAVRELSDLICRGLDDGVVRLCDSIESSPKHTEIANTYTVGATDDRPWGRWTVLEGGDDWCVKRLDVLPGQTLSLQYHHFRDEVWVVAKGIAEVTIGDTVKRLKVGQSATIQREQPHRMANVSADQDLVIIELQTGTRLDEDDIIRLSDVYDRV